MGNERLTLEEVAREAGVSLATADRVINRRQGVRAKTVAQVERAIGGRWNGGRRPAVHVAPAATRG